MQFQKNPNAWSCLPTSFAMCMDVPVEEVLSRLSQDGSKITFPKRKGFPYRGYHWMEVQAAAFELGFVTMTFEHFGSIGESQEECVPAMDWGIDHKRPTVVTGLATSGNGHAVAYDPGTKLYYDPRGYVLKRCPVTHIMSFAIFDLRKVS